MDKIKPRDFEELIGQYWDLAYGEGKTGKSLGSQANVILGELRAALAQARIAGMRELTLLNAELAGLRAYAITLKKAAEPFCAIKADDGDAFNGYAPETIIRCEITVRDLRGLRMCSGYGDPVAGSAIDSAIEEKEHE
jgi:hypothetical protein